MRYLESFEECQYILLEEERELRGWRKVREQAQGMRNAGGKEEMKRPFN